MKKMIAWVLTALLLVGIFAGCSTEKDTHDISSAQSTNIPKEEQKNEAMVTEETAEAITIDNVVVYDSDGITVTATGMEDGWTGTEIKLLIENTTNKNIALSGDTAIVNGVTIPVYLYIDVAAEKKTNGTMSLYSSELDLAGIEKIATINVKDSRIVDTDNYDTLANAPFEIITSVGADYIQTVDETGDILFESNGVRVIAKTISGDVFGEEVVLFVKNDSDKDITVEAENISVNGFTIDGWMYDTVYAETVRFCGLEIFSSSLEENEITEVEDVSFTINLIDPVSYKRIAKSEEIQIIINQ